MRQLIIATMTLFVLTGVSAALSLRGQLLPVTYCDQFAAYSHCHDMARELVVDRRLPGRSRSFQSLRPLMAT